MTFHIRFVFYISDFNAVISDETQCLIRVSMIERRRGMSYLETSLGAVQEQAADMGRVDTGAHKRVHVRMQEIPHLQTPQ